jgi:hypothetical protein
MFSKKIVFLTASLMIAIGAITQVQAMEQLTDDEKAVAAEMRQSGMNPTVVQAQNTAALLREQERLRAQQAAIRADLEAELAALRATNNNNNINNL